MPLYYITGLAGTGKSSVCHELRERGYEAHDSDDNLARWVNKETGYVHPKSSVKKEARTPEFLATHDWKLPRAAVQELAQEARGKTVFLCGVGGNEAELHDLFAAMFALVVDDETLRHRLQTRESNNWGKQPHELALTLSWQEPARADYKKFGHIVIDATQSLPVVVDSVLEQVDALENEGSLRS